MSGYFYKNDILHIEDYQNKKKFSSFLPGIGGVNGKPMWTFYANIGQCISGFGVESKEYPITPFDSAFNAYKNIPTQSFVTFIKVNGQYIKLFARQNKSKQTMIIKKATLIIKEQFKLFDVVISYTNVVNKPYPGLVRKVTLINKSNKDLHIEGIDGLPIILPYGLSNYAYKELSTLMSAYCKVDNLDSHAPYYAFKSSTSDTSQIVQNRKGNTYLSLDEDSNRLENIVDGKIVFGDDETQVIPEKFIGNGLEVLNSHQECENQLPSAFSTFSFNLTAKEEKSFISLFSSFDSLGEYNKLVDTLTFSMLNECFALTEKLIEDLLSPAYIKTSHPLFDGYYKHSMLDNGLRGGFVEQVGNKSLYVYSRKHGDMERDYNAFVIPSTYYSSGQGNFRDVNQNRRNDLYYYPQLEDDNIYLFFSLIQIDGNNPLVVKPYSYSLENEKEITSLFNKKMEGELFILLSKYYPGQLYSYLLEHQSSLNVSPLTAFNIILECSKTNIEASFGEGYWVDHWTYNLDLIENYLSVYPDKLASLMLRDDYRYFNSKVMVKPRREKYVLANGLVRQYESINEDTKHLYLTNSNYLCDEHGKEVTTTLINKIINLIFTKFASLDPLQMGIEMNNDKPGWNDSLNGLPGIFGSSLNETIELIRLIKFAKQTLAKLKVKNIKVLKEQFSFYRKVGIYLKDKENELYDKYNFWDVVSNAKEAFFSECLYNVSGATKEMTAIWFNKVLTMMLELLDDSINNAYYINNDMFPTYLSYKPIEYTISGFITTSNYQSVDVLQFDVRPLPLFLEGYARLLKLGNEYISEEDLDNLKNSDVYDKVLKNYKTSASLENETFEIGRVRAFSPGWLERESIFLHMSYKFLLGLLKGGFYKRFYEEIKDTLVCYKDIEQYGRSIFENSSFIAASVHPNTDLHGQGFYARLTGANAEFLEMVNMMFYGESLFKVEKGELVFAPNPLLSEEYFDKKNEAKILLFDKVLIVYHNRKRLNCYEGVDLTYVINDKKYQKVKGSLAKEIRCGQIKRIDIYIEERK